MVFMEQAAYSSSVAPVYNDLDLLVVGYDGTSETSFYPNNLATKDSANTVEMVTVSAVDSYEWFNVRARRRNMIALINVETATLIVRVLSDACAILAAPSPHKLGIGTTSTERDNKACCFDYSQVQVALVLRRTGGGLRGGGGGGVGGAGGGGQQNSTLFR